MSKVVLSNNNKITNRPSSKCEATPQAYSKQQRKEIREENKYTNIVYPVRSKYDLLWWREQLSDPL